MLARSEGRNGPWFEDVAIARIHDRGTCPLDGTPVAGATAACPHCGTPAVRRVDDAEIDTIRRRFAAYRASVLPIVDAWERDGLELLRFDARGPIEALDPFAGELAGRILA